MLIALGALGVMLATMLLLGNQSVEQTVHQQVVSRYGDYDMQFGYVKNDAYLNDGELKIDSLENAEKYQNINSISNAKPARAYRKTIVLGS